MSDHAERNCMRCGSLLHHDCSRREPLTRDRLDELRRLIGLDRWQADELFTEVLRLQSKLFAARSAGIEIRNAIACTEFTGTDLELDRLDKAVDVLRALLEQL